MEKKKCGGTGTPFFKSPHRMLKKQERPREAYLKPVDAEKLVSTQRKGKKGEGALDTKKER